MKPLSSKRMIRIEKKKKKMAALMEITKLNEHDRNNKNLRVTSEPVETEPSPKRIRTELYQKVDDNNERTTDEKTGKSSEKDSLADAGGMTAKPKLTGEEFLKLKKLLRENTNRLKQVPRFRLREQGEAASLSVDIENRVPLFLSDIQHLVMYSQIGHHSPYAPTRWCQLEKFNKVAHTNVLIVENLSVYNFLGNESSFSFLSSTFNLKLEILNPNMYKGDIIRDINMVPISSTQMKKFVSTFGTLEAAVTKSNDVFDLVRNMFPVEKETPPTTKKTGGGDLPASDKFPRTHLLLSGWQMVEENFPLPIKGLMEHKYTDYVFTKDRYKDVTPVSPMFGLDCEMCVTTLGDSELTRISIVDEDLKEVYEQLVKPDNRITDYLTRFSGITPKMMKNVTKRLQDVQQDIRRILPEDAILVGQSIGNDLHAMKMMHPYIIDTSIIFNITGDRTRKTKLKTLSAEFLNEVIQEGSGGHCSAQDSAASMKLAKLKLTQSLYYGDAVMSNVQLQIRQHPELGHSNYATSMLKQCTKMERTALVVGSEDVTTRYKYYTSKSQNHNEEKMKFVTETSNKAIVEKLCDSMSQYTLNIAQVTRTDRLEEEKADAFRNVDDWIKQIYERSEPSSLTIVIFGGEQNSANGCCFIRLKTS